jgi:hypothetical protein
VRELVSPAPSLAHVVSLENFAATPGRAPSEIEIRAVRQGNRLATVVTSTAPGVELPNELPLPALRAIRSKLRRLETCGVEKNRPAAVASLGVREAIAE